MELTVIRAWLMRLTAILMLIPSTGSAIWTYQAYEMMIAPLGWDLWGRFLALVGAAMVFVLYWLGSTWLLNFVAALRGRYLAMALVFVVPFAASVLGASSIPQVMIFHAPAREAEMIEYIAATAKVGDTVQSGVDQVNGIRPVIEDAAAEIDELARLERAGRLSGLRGPGPVVDWITAQARRLRQALSSLGLAATGTAAIFEQRGRAADAMRGAIKDNTLTFSQRRRTLEAQGDVLRGLIHRLGGASGRQALLGLSAALQGTQAMPALSSNANTRAKQMRAIRSVQSVLRRVGKDIAKRVKAFDGLLRADVPVYRPLPTSKLIFVYWEVLAQAWMVSLSIDGFIFILLAFAIIGNHAIEAQLSKPDYRPAWEVEAERALDAAERMRVRVDQSFRHAESEPFDFGPHPHEHATRARAAAAKQAARTNGRADGAGGADRKRKNRGEA